MTWALYCLLQHPDHLRAVEDEVRHLPVNASEPTCIRHLPLLNACLSESLRLYPTTPTLEATCTASSPILVGPTHSGSFAGNTFDVIVHPGQTIAWSPWVMARSPTIWGAEAEEWKPERWGDEQNAPPVYEPSVIKPGNVQCVEGRILRMTIIVALKELLERYQFQAEYVGERAYDDGAAYTMTGGLPISVSKRT